MQIVYLLSLTASLRMDLKISSFLRVLLSIFLSVVYTGHLFKRLVIRNMLLVSVSSEVNISIISPLIMEVDPEAIAVLVSYSNRYLVLSNGLEYEIFRAWYEWLYLASQ